jgi:CheY-like chemotaxis protein
MAELRDSTLRACGLAAPRHQPALETTATHPANSKTMDILLAEDNPVNQMLMMRLLSKRGYRVTIANNGREAVQALERQRFDLVLMDVQMPELDGFQATMEIREKQLGMPDRVPIIALTAHAMSGDRDRCLAAGMDGYLTKPINPKELDIALRPFARAAVASADAAVVNEA